MFRRALRLHQPLLELADHAQIAAKREHASAFADLERRIADR